MANQLAEQVEVDQFDTYTKFLALAQKHKNKTRFRAAIFEAGLDKYANEDSAFAGYFRVLDRDTELLVPLCLYYDEHGDLVILYRTEAEQENENAQVRLSHVWPWAMWSPISYDHWEAAYKGKGWWDQDAAIDELKKVGDWRATGGSPPIGDNQPPDEFKLDAEDPVSVQKWFDKLQAAPEQYTTIDSDEKREKSQSRLSEIAKVANTLDKKREALVAPHLKAQKDINGKYNPVVHALKAAVKAIGAAQTAWANAKLQRQLQAEREEAAKRDEEARQRQAEVARAEAENRPPPPPPPPRPEPQPTVLRPQEFRGGTGRMAKEEFEDAITAVLDWKALFAWSSDDAQAQALVLDRAKRRFKDTGEIPAGVEIGKVAKIRR